MIDKVIIKLATDFVQLHLITTVYEHSLIWRVESIQVGYDYSPTFGVLP